MLNTYLNRQLSQAELSIQELQAKGLLRTFTNKQLIDYLSIDRKANKKKDDELFCMRANEYINEKKKPNTKEAYKTAIDSLSTYCDYEQLTFADIDKRFLEGYKTFLQNKGNTKGTIDAIKNSRIQYDREKTGKHYSIKVEPEMLEIINRYKGKEHLLRFFDYKKDNYYRSFGNLISNGLRGAASTLSITEPLSAYYARHSWATLAIEIGASMEMVSAGLGHEIGAQVTQVYIAFQQKQVDELSRKVIDYIFEKGEYAPKEENGE